ncbi:hypothetical protein LY08_00686 [Olleya aquimaris]|uniref:Uncharacterized protein n=2 Tax=Olleya aquimaris TaxID=639310 RepID=A0A327RIW4_9FLAO|nr:hypothetical protein LY08_00686 [Olleya aquimaris]
MFLKIAFFSITKFGKALLFSTLLMCSLFSYAQTDIFEVSRNGTLEDIEAIYKQDQQSINKKNDQGYTPLTLACYNGNVAVANFLAGKVDDINGNSNYGTPLMAAVYKGYTKIVAILLQHDANPNIQDKQGGTAMHYAVLFKKYDIIKLLVDADADFNIKNNANKSALDFAISYKDETLNELLNLK